MTKNTFFIFIAWLLFLAVCPAPAADTSSLPKVLIIGDSISGGYSKPLAKLLSGKAELVKLGSVAGYRIQKQTFWHSRGTAKNLDFGSAKACIADFERFERHLSETKYDVIHFNFGLNDIFRGRKGTWHNPVAQYEKDLAKIVALLKTNGAKVIWASTTPIPDNDEVRPVGDDLIYNAAAARVMKAGKIPINDLHGLVTAWDGYAEWKKGDDVHFSGAVYAKLAEQVAKAITDALGEQAPARPRSFASMQQSLEPSKVITYKTIGERELTLHIFHPKGFKADDSRPAYLLFHGGGWRSGTPRRFYPYAASLVPDGFVGISAEYRLTGSSTVFDCVKDGRAAIRYVRRHAKTLGIDPGRITVGGGSAGGHVALGTALFDTVEHADEDLSVSCKPDALVLLFSVLDTSPAGYGNKVIGADWQRISPLHQIRPKMPPTLIFHGDKDNVAPYPTLMAFYKKMQDSQNVCELVLEPGGEHGHINTDMALFDDAAERTKTFLAKQQLSSKRGKQKILPANATILQVAGHSAFLALPEDVKAGQKTPWLWYFPSDYKLPGKLEQWMINKCLTNGIAVAGIDVVGDFGTPAGRATFTAFYNELIENHGVTQKACLLARSYGGIQMYNWAAEHPDSVACLAGIYPVCNMASYPGLKSAASKYKMSLEQFSEEFKQHNPIDRLAPLAKAKVPIYHNTGDVDKLVPAKDNTMIVADRYKALGGDMTITVFKGQGHNYWTGFFEDEAMAEFIITHAKRVAGLRK